MDLNKVKQLIELMEQADVQEIELKEGDESIRICRRLAVTSNTVVTPQQVSTTDDNRPVGKAVKGHIVRAPMVGTFYQAASPASPAFVEPGAQVKPGDTVCIIESMKMMNQIKAEQAGVIEAILVVDGAAVEYDQPLFTIN
ncbi:MAG: acetyl-CoA carboxylase biotin carboxyl carrier protein [Pseudomonadales bacterium]|nr:acetyl-CoA carboxylase biotin carboxyl carrier protein [Pseudomonadales bacterium]